jgi:hypothetical protein
VLSGDVTGMWRLTKRRKHDTTDANSVIEFTVSGEGALVQDPRELIKLRSVAAEVGGSSFELADRDGDLAIALSVPSVKPPDAALLIQRFCELAGFQPPE